jgi:hypothetical protein
MGTTASPPAGVATCLPSSRHQFQDLAPATVDNHLASRSACTTWVAAQALDLCWPPEPDHARRL